MVLIWILYTYTVPHGGGGVRLSAAVLFELLIDGVLVCVVCWCGLLGEGLALWVVVGGGYLVCVLIKTSSVYMCHSFVNDHYMSKEGKEELLYILDMILEQNYLQFNNQLRTILFQLVTNADYNFITQAPQSETIIVFKNFYGYICLTFIVHQ
jgi:hypothetical protein